MDGPKPNDIARCLNALALMNMQDIASADTISDLLNDYFITRPIGNDESDSDLCESSDDDCVTRNWTCSWMRKRMDLSTMTVLVST